MTAPGATAPQPGRASTAGRPAGALLVLLLVGLLAVLPCAGRAQAAPAKPGQSPATTVTAALPDPSAATAHSAAPATRASGTHGHGVTTRTLYGLPLDGGLPLTWCSVDGDHPVPGSGCSSHPFCAQESQLPNAPPQPAAAVPNQPLSPEAPPRPAAPTAPTGLDHAPDLHVLQVQRS
ncbi:MULTISPECIES: hypothetical protein [Kitasatospora]